MKKEIFTDTEDNEKSDKTTAIQESSVILNLKIRMKSNFLKHTNYFKIYKMWFHNHEENSQIILANDALDVDCFTSKQQETYKE